MKNFSEKSAPTQQTEIEALKEYGWHDDEIAGMSPAQRRREFLEATGIGDLPREQADQAVSARGSLKPEGGEPGGPEAATEGEPETPKGSTSGAPTEQTEVEALKRCGWSDEDIASMSPAQRRAEFQDAMETFQDAMETGQSEPTAELAPRRGNPSKPVLTKNLSGKFIYGGLGVIFLFTIFRVVFEQQETPSVVAGWDGISNCSFMVSFNGKRRLLLSENHFARIEEPDQASGDGSWSFDGSTGRYTVTVHDEPVTYSVVAPGDGDNCMLIKGELATADLPRSWFYSSAIVDDQSDNETPER